MGILYPKSIAVRPQSSRSASRIKKQGGEVAGVHEGGVPVNKLHKATAKVNQRCRRRTDAASWSSGAQSWLPGLRLSMVGRRCFGHLPCIRLETALRLAAGACEPQHRAVPQPDQLSPRTRHMFGRSCGRACTVRADFWRNRGGARGCNRA